MMMIYLLCNVQSNCASSFFYQMSDNFNIDNFNTSNYSILNIVIKSIHVFYDIYNLYIYGHEFKYYFKIFYHVIYIGICCYGGSYYDMVLLILSCMESLLYVYIEYGMNINNTNMNINNDKTHQGTIENNDEKSTNIEGPQITLEKSDQKVEEKYEIDSIFSICMLAFFIVCILLMVNSCIKHLPFVFNNKENNYDTNLPIEEKAEESLVQYKPNLQVAKDIVKDDLNPQVAKDIVKDDLNQLVVTQDDQEDNDGPNSQIEEKVKEDDSDQPVVIQDNQEGYNELHSQVEKSIEQYDLNPQVKEDIEQYDLNKSVVTQDDKEENNGFNLQIDEQVEEDFKQDDSDLKVKESLVQDKPNKAKDIIQFQKSMNKLNLSNISNRNNDNSFFFDDLSQKPQKRLDFNIKSSNSSYHYSQSISSIQSKKSR